MRSALLNLAVDVLVVCAPPKTNNDPGIRHIGAEFVPTMRVLQWLLGQGLLIRSPDGFYQSIPGALDELLCRVESGGDASPGAPTVPQDPFAVERRAAREKLDLALHAGGYRDQNDGSRRLRAIK
jgi:hypothetical protein